MSEALVLALGIALGLLVASVAAFAALRRGREHSRAYLKGVRSLLSEDADAALEALTRAARISPETVETYFALAAVFRKKGDFERAIRVHQNIGLMPGLDEATRHDALERLGEDFRAAGMLGRAVETFERLTAADPSRTMAWSALAGLLVELERFEEALAAAANAKLPAREQAWMAAHGALVLARAGEEERARALAGEAARLDPGGPAAALGAGASALVAKDLAGARAAWEQALGRVPGALEVVLPHLEAALPDAELEDFLRERVETTPGDALPRLALARLYKKLGRAAEAAGALDAALAAAPALSVAARPYRCAGCGKEQLSFALRCPACGQWGAVA